MNKIEFKELFLKLTEWTIPFGEESKLEKYLPTGFKKDKSGNYFYEIGESKTLFTCHLDTYSPKMEKVNHVIDDKDPFIIKTDGNTILGGDNKLGCTILIGMIGNKIPGTYYFFVGEEPILSGGLFGSSNALESNPEYFKKFNKCVAFDRRGYGSIVVRQMGRMCCSPEFAKAIADEFDIKGIKWDSESGFGYYTDTAVFMDVIEECTNISAGGFNEHYVTEWVDLNYTYQVYEAAIGLDWESLPVKRELEKRFYEEKPKSSLSKYLPFNSDRKQIDNYEKIKKLFKLFGMTPTRNILNGGIRTLTFSKWLEDFDFDIILKGDNIIYDGSTMDYDSLLNIIIKTFRDDIIDEIEYYLDLSEKGVKSSTKSLNELLKSFGQTDPYIFLDYLDSL